MSTFINGLQKGRIAHRNILATLAVGIALLVGQVSASANKTPFSQIVVFGDSTSDTGNCYRMTGGFYPPSEATPPAKWGYWQGHFSNGPMWVEYLAEDLGMPGLLENYAVAGATSGTENNGLPFGGVHDQIELYFSSHPQGADPDALYILWSGHNDLFLGLPEAYFLENTVSHLQTLFIAGARHILVPNISDIGKIPALLVYGSDYSAYVSQIVSFYNQGLASALDDLAMEGIPTVHMDAFWFGNYVGTHPAEFGISNMTDQGMLVDDPIGYYFFDEAHPTTQAHHAIGEFAVRCLVDYYSPSQGKGQPPAQVNALNGLVRAGKGQ